MDTMIFDFETRSRANLKKTGAYKYAEDPSTEILCIAYTLLETDSDTKLWVMGDPAPKDLIEHIENGGLLLAHNAFFERCVWHFAAHKRLGWPDVSPEQWRCSVAVCRYKALPGALGAAAQALDLDVVKDVKGKTLIGSLSNPKKDGTFNEDPALLQEMYSYCIQDVKTTKALVEKIGTLPPRELDIWQLDQEINFRGICVDTLLAETVIQTLAEVEEVLLEEVESLTDGEIKTAGQRDKILAWAEREGVTLPGYTATIVDSVLASGTELPEKVRRVLEIRQILGKSSTAKYKKILARSASDNRVHEILVYHKAHTGRWAGAGVQLQNMPRPSTNEDPEKIIESFFWGAEEVEEKYSNPFRAAADIVRSSIIAAPGREFIVADYSAVEARILLWVAEDENALDIFRRGECIYCEMASSIYSTPAKEIYKRYKAGDFEAGEMRFMGKSVGLGVGYQMGAPKFKATVQQSSGKIISDSLAQRVVDTYRVKFSKVKQLWYALEKAAASAVKHRGKVFFVSPTKRVAFKADDNYLYCKLPSGRLIHYPNAELKTQTTSWGDPKLSLVYKSFGSGESTTYGGKLAENICQAISRDLVADAMLAVERAGYPVVLSVHDEIGSEVPEGFGSVEDYCDLMCTASPWAEGLPLKAEGWRGKRFKK